jgi:hypothetical protein
MKKPSEEIYNEGKIFTQSPIALEIHKSCGAQNDVLDILFANFVAYAAANWSYNATSIDTTSQGLLDGDGGTKPACATIEGAFRILVNTHMPNVQTSQAKLEGTDGKFWVKPSLKCFDKNVIGNIGNPGANAQQQFGVGTYFYTHYFAKVGERFYDPCLMSSYETLREPIHMQSKLFLPGLGRHSPQMIKIGMGRNLKVLELLPNKPVPGFGSTYTLWNPKDCKKILKKDGLKIFQNDKDIKAGGFF